MLEKFSGNNFTYTRVSKQEQERRHILGRLSGIIASTTEPTRNGRGYSLKLWEKVFENPIMQEKIKNRCVFGELGHPEDRTEIDMEKAAICLAEVPKVGSDGNLYGVFDILDTPNGRILKSFCDYGTTIGVSSRGQGDLIQDEHGNEIVDPDTYDCECWDAVLVPAVEIARMKQVNESLNNRGTKLKRALKEAVENASEDDKRIMKDTLKDLNIDIDDSETVSLDSLEDGVDDAVEDEEDLEKEETAEDEVMDDEPLDDDVEPEDADSDVDGSYDIDTDNCTPEEFVEFMQGYIADTADIIDNAEECISKIEDEEKQAEVSAKLDTLKEQAQLLADEFAKISSFLNDEIDSLEDEAEEVDDEEVETEEEPEEEEQEEDSDADEASDDTDEEDEEDEQDDDDDADDDGTAEIVESLKKSLSNQRKLEQSKKALQEKLAVSDTKVTKLSEEVERYKNATARMSEIAKSSKTLKEKIDELTESLNQKDSELQESRKEIADQKNRIARLVQGRKNALAKAQDLDESLNKSNKQNEKVNSVLNEQLTLNEAKAKEQIKKLTEELNATKKTSEQKINALNEDVKKANAMKESYKKLANSAVNKYIQVKAMTLGLSERDIKRKLGESYTLDDVDQVCEDLKSYNLNVSRLPFDVNGKVQVKVKESIHPVRSTQSQYDDDAVDDALLRMANLD